MIPPKVFRWYRSGTRSRRDPVVILAATTVIICLIYYIFKILLKLGELEENLDISRRYIETKLEEALKEDKGAGCEFPHLDPFSKEVTQYEGPTRYIRCLGRNWVRCYLSKCRVVDEILATTQNIKCIYRDIIYEGDFKRSLGSPTMVLDGEVYTLRKSDHVKVKCKGQHIDHFFSSNWAGVAVGFRTDVERKVPPSGRENSLDVLILGFDSTSRNRFIRKMPKSYAYLKHELGAVILDKYHIVGDGTPAALFPILSGKTELELPDARKSTTNTFNNTHFIFNKLKEDGYRTAYFEDMPWVGTFQYRFNGFTEQPADHYIRALHQEELDMRNTWKANDYFCVGDTLNYKLMMNVTEQFFKLDGKHFAFTFIVDIVHDDLDTIGIADLDTRSFLKSLKDSGVMDHTLVMVMSDHGVRFGKICDTLQGKFEQRMPLMAIRLPETLKQRRPEVEAILKNNSRVLTTPHDIHATLLDAMDLKQYHNDYKIKGADLTRGLSLFERIPASRSCSEAGIEPHWCACVVWDVVPTTEAIYSRAATAFVHYINSLTEPVRLQCVPRTLISILWVKRRRANSKMLAFQQNLGSVEYVAKFYPNYKSNNDYYQIKVSVGPGYGIFEATTAYFMEEDIFVFDVKDISRTNAFGKICDTLQGKFEQRMPLMAIRLPETLKQRRPEVEAILKNNSRVLTTPHDIHATLLDAMDLKQYHNDYKIKGADLTRGLSLFERIPASRSCSEAGIEPHWCACVVWDVVPTTEAIYSRAATAFVHYINSLTEPVRLQCVPRTLISILWVKRRRANSKMLAFQQNLGSVEYVAKFYPNYKSNNDYYQIKVSVGPGYGIFEATTAYFMEEDIFVFDVKDISRTNAYNGEPNCISASHPHLNFFCYCHNNVSN